MNSYARFFCGDQSGLSWIGWNRLRDKQLFFGSLFFATSIYAAVHYSEEKERRRRHVSIENDIERERWRAKELGLEEPRDDGFADAYMKKLRGRQ
ncbi:hypothetical protein C3747_16g1164c [Trypanosoma cruzi]|uniref:Uncharacterized protein n=2 Tax=Trypanosoma cruzi TaxID=5693 RepID=Q4D907_TRYCC|nr:hypothetical protein, conserved [Trypanosoma cruzi]EAN89012.1 hypothetical protein, conserved [Trypanosoma cruzi]PWV17895.1 hypothetical protein C3747_16g1164c [Trypanosoma cruzi]|eukprot:XP_810863.1 hypothetical protein [Trypanosoma cruzi strain CL Brener]